MSRRRTKPLPVELLRKVEGPKILKALGEARREPCLSPIPLRSPDKIVASDLVGQIDAMAELLTGDRTHFHTKLHSWGRADCRRAGTYTQRNLILPTLLVLSRLGPLPVLPAKPRVAVPLLWT
ncbi:hypothetical protein MAE02_64500 [Microvirga aerophila]|uniref:Uncharacterized protein n=1 Tax=Microvirga aerophila TaxID=670291 RepID=A0A512C3G8_9HYPH|nr:hypothetical protein MAE02_64500 [Microvirga aerophila]